MFEKALTLYVLDEGDQREIPWPPGVSLPSAGDLFVWNGEERWIDDVTWCWNKNLAGEPRVICFLSLGLDDDNEAVCACGERH